jgi:hypothetical protein
MTQGFDFSFEPLSINRTSDDCNTWYESPEAFWKAVRNVRFLGHPASLMRHQWNASQNEMLSGSTAPRLALLGGASQRSVQNYLYPDSYRPHERLNHGGRRSERRGSGPGSSNIFCERKHWDEVGVVPFEDRLGAICGFAFFEGNEHIPNDVVYKPVRGRGTEGGLAMLVTAHRRTIKAFEGMLFIVPDLITALRAQMRWLKNLQRPLPLVVPRHDDRQQTRSAWNNLPPSRRILITSELSSADLQQARLANASIVVCPRLIEAMVGHGGVSWPWRKAVELAKPWKHVLRQTLITKPAAEAQALCAEMEWSAAERAKFLDRTDDSVKSRIAVWFPDVLATRSVVGSTSVIEKGDNWIDEGSGVVISPIIRIAQLLRTSLGMEKADGHVTIGGRPHDFRVSMANIEKVGLLAAVRRSLRAKGVIMNYKSGWSHRAWQLASTFSDHRTIEQADVVGCTGDDFRFPNFAITFHGFSLDEATPLPPRMRPAGKLQPPVDLHTLELGLISSATPGVGLFWAVLRVFLLYTLAPLHTRKLPACVLLGDHADELANTIANSFDTLLLKTPGRADAEAALRKLATITARHTWPSVISLPTRCSDVSTKLLNGLPAEQLFIAAPGLELSDIRNGRYWAIQVREFDEARGLIEKLGVPILLHYLKDLKARQCSYEDWSDDWKDCAWKGLGMWFSRLSRSREARNQSDKLICFGLNEGADIRAK